MIHKEQPFVIISSYDRDHMDVCNNCVVVFEHITDPVFSLCALCFVPSNVGNIISHHSVRQ